MGFSIATANEIAAMQSVNRGVTESSSSGDRSGVSILDLVSKIPGAGAVIDIANGRTPDLNSVPILPSLLGGFLGGAPSKNPYTERPDNPANNVVDEAKKTLMYQSGSDSNKSSSDVVKYATVAVFGLALVLLLH